MTKCVSRAVLLAPIGPPSWGRNRRHAEHHTRLIALFELAAR